MRVLHVSAYYAPAYVYGGPPRSIHGLCKALRAAGIDVQVFSTDANGSTSLAPDVAVAEEYEGVPVRYFPRTWPLEPIGSRELKAALGASIGGFDLVHIHGLWNRVVWSAARQARAAGVPYVLSPRGMLQDAARAHRRWRKRLAYAAIERHTVTGAAVLHATSDAERDALARIAPAAQIAVIPNGIDLTPPVSQPSAAAKDIGVPGDRPLIAFVGRLHPIKRVDLLLEATARLAARGSHAHLVIAGPDEQGMRSGLAARYQHIADRVTWLDTVDAPTRDALLSRARAFVLCSDSESFGMTALEAMAAGCPVVVTRTCGWIDLETDGAGRLVEQSADAIADAVAGLIADPAAAAAMGARGRALAHARYGWPSIASTFASTYHQIIAARHRRDERVA